MAVQVATPGELHKRDTRPLMIDRSAERHGLKTRIRALVGFWENVTEGRSSSKHTYSQKDHVIAKDLWRPFRSVAEQVGSLPNYEECLLDLPPDYSATDSLAYAQCMQDTEVAANRDQTRIQPNKGAQLFNRPYDVKVDFGSEAGYRSHAGKKAKKAAKAAAKSKWADSDNEENKEDAPAGDDGNNGGDGAGGDGAGDGGGDPPNGGGDGGGDDGDDWFGGGGKKASKKKKKKAWVSWQKCLEV